MPDGQYTQLKDYVVFLWLNSSYLVLFLGEVVTQFGNWFNLVASYKVVEDLSNGSGEAIATLLVIRNLPRLLWFPFAGALADTYDRAGIMVVVSLLSSLLSASVPLILGYKSLWLFFLMNFLEFSLGTFYDPAKSALIPMVVPQKQLILSSTLDSFAWSLMGAVGASLGGFAVTYLGVSGCFYIDAVTFVVAALCAVKVLGVKPLKTDLETDPDSPTLKKPHNTAHYNAPGALDPENAEYQPLNTADVDSRLPRGAEKRADGKDLDVDYSGGLESANGNGGLASQEVDVDSPVHQFRECHESPDSRMVEGSHAMEQGEEWLPESGVVDVSISCRTSLSECGKGGGEDAPLIIDALTNAASRETVGLPNYCRAEEEDASDTKKTKSQIQAMKEGFRYLLAKKNRHILLFVMIKACAAISWGGNDVVNVKWSEMDSMHVIGGSSETLGLLYGMVGLGCFIGPLFSNSLLPANVAGWMLGTAIAFGMRTVGYLVLVYPNFWLLLASSVFRSAGSNIMWISATAMVQSTADNERQGAVFAFEFAMYTVAVCLSTYLTGVGFDELHWSAPFTCFVLGMVTAVLMVFWSVQAYIYGKREKEALRNAIRYEALLAENAVCKTCTEAGSIPGLQRQPCGQAVSEAYITSVSNPRHQPAEEHGLPTGKYSACDI